MKMVNNRFGILLAEKRIKERRPIPLSEVAEATGISRKTLYAWENNKVNRFDVPVIDALCRYFGIEPGELFQFVEDDRPINTQINEYADTVYQDLPVNKKELKENVKNVTLRKPKAKS